MVTRMLVLSALDCSVLPRPAQQQGAVAVQSSGYVLSHPRRHSRAARGQRGRSGRRGRLPVCRADPVVVAAACRVTAKADLTNDTRAAPTRKRAAEQRTAPPPAKRARVPRVPPHAMCGGGRLSTDARRAARREAVRASVVRRVRCDRTSNPDHLHELRRHDHPVLRGALNADRSREQARAHTRERNAIKKYKGILSEYYIDWGNRIIMELTEESMNEMDIN